MTSSPLVLITGGNGFVGFAVLSGILRAGYRVRAAIRRQDAIDTVSRGPSIQLFLSNGALTFTLIPDNTIPNAYTEAAKGCSYIIHVASPLATMPGDLVTQALAGTKAILEAANKTPSVKRVVFTASISSIRPFEQFLASHPANQANESGRGKGVDILTADTVVPTQPKVPDKAPGFHRYINSKIACRNLVDDYAKKTDESHFSIVNIMPGWIFGPEALSRAKSEAFKGSNLVLGFLFFPLRFNSLLGLDDDPENVPLLAEAVHIDDVVESHVNALDIEKVPGIYRNFILCSESPSGPIWNDAVDICRRGLSQEVADGLIPLAGRLGTIPGKFDASPAERDLLGHPFQPFEKQVKDTVKWYVYLQDH